MESTRKINRRLVGAIAAILALVPVSAHAAGSGPTGPSTAVSFEEIPGSTLKRVILTAKAAERIGIETGEVREQQITRTQMVGGLVTPPVEIPQDEEPLAGGTFGGFSLTAMQPSPKITPDMGAATPGDETWVLVTLSPGELKRVDLESPVRILPLPTRNELQGEVLANPSKMPLLEDRKRSMLKVFYIVARKDNGLKPGQRVRVEMPLVGSGEKHMVVPYSAVYWDGNGDAWVYANPKPLVYERQAVKVQHVTGDLAVLSAGPPLGTEVVTVGAALLYGAEVIFKR